MRALAIGAVGFSVLLHGRSADAGSCESLSHLLLPNTKVTLAEVVAPGNFTIDPRFFPRSLQGVLKNLPAFCRVGADIQPTPDSDILIEVWMPLSGWNGKFEGTGNGGWAGHRVAQELEAQSEFLQLPDSYAEMATALGEGYATAGTDTGHAGSGGDASFAFGPPEKVVDFGYRAVHEMTLKAKAIVSAFYGRKPSPAYWNGCSTGGKQGLTEAQRFPSDYDGIVAGAPANYWTHLMAGDVWTAQATHSTAASYIPLGEYSLLHKAALDACDARDGLKDGVIEDPLRCHFDPGVLQCRQGERVNCLTDAQVEAARKIYAGPKNPRTDERVFPGLEPGSEMQWGVMAGAPEPPIVASYFKYRVFGNPEWDYRTLNFDQNVALADKLDESVLNATDPNISAFIAHGGKLLLYHGWSDGLIAPENTVDYYESVLRRLGHDETRNSVRLFMVPGMGHCRGGDGTDQFDAVAAMDQWMTTGEAPDRIVAAHRWRSSSRSGFVRTFGNGSTVTKTRPLCPFPQVAKYIGTGSTDDAANFACVAADTE